MFGDDLASYLPDYLRPFAEQLKQFPKDYEKWVYAGSLANDTFQGDVFGVMRFVRVDDDGSVMQAEFAGMVISSTCDAQPEQSDYILVAPIISLDDYRKAKEAEGELQGEELDNHIRALEENKLSQIMFLPDISGLGRAFVDFGNISTISTKYFHATYLDMKIASLSQYGHYFLLMKLAYHLTRPESRDANRN